MIQDLLVTYIVDVKSNKPLLMKKYTIGIIHKKKNRLWIAELKSKSRKMDPDVKKYGSD